MKNRPFRWILISIFFLHSNVHALSLLAQGKEDLVALKTHARENVNSSNAGSVPHSILAYFLDQNNCIGAKCLLSVERQVELFHALDQFDHAVTIPNKIARTKSLVAAYGNIERNVDSLLFESCGAGRRRARQVPKVGHKKATAKKKSKTVKRKKVNHLPEMEPDSFMQIIYDFLSEHKWDIGMGLLAIYSLLAKANDWPPFDKQESSEPNDSQSDSNASQSNVLPDQGSQPSSQHNVPTIKPSQEGSNLDGDDDSNPLGDEPAVITVVPTDNSDSERTEDTYDSAKDESVSNDESLPISWRDRLSRGASLLYKNVLENMNSG